MRCIFCKQNTKDSKSIEHIIPESLGNKEHTLPPGIVCDSCNNYFAVKIEKPFLEQPFFRSLRSRNFIQGKRGRIPPDKGILKGGIVDIQPSKEGLTVIINDERVLKDVLNSKSGRIWIPSIEKPEPRNKTVSRFLGKVAIEILASRILHLKGWNDEIVDKEELDSLRRYVRYGDRPKYWEYHERKIYGESQQFIDPANGFDEPYRVLHELDLIYTESFEMFLVIVIMGNEYAINLANPNIDTYKKWLSVHNQISKLDINETRKKTIPKNGEHS